MRPMIEQSSPHNHMEGQEGEEVMTAVKALAGWINQNYTYPEPLTHLKIQKLLFYCYGALLASDMEAAIGPNISFEAWEHGPVNRELYRLFCQYGANPIPEFPKAGTYSAAVENTMRDSLKVYGCLDAWALRQQTHTESPWIKAYKERVTYIDQGELKKFFKTKYSYGSVQAPEYVFGMGSFRIDNIPVGSYKNLGSLAETVERVFKEAPRKRKV